IVKFVVYHFPPFMKKIIGLVLLIGSAFFAIGQAAKQYLAFELPDPVRAGSFFAAIKPDSLGSNATWWAGIQTRKVSLYMSKDGKQQGFTFAFPEGSEIKATGTMVSKGPSATLHLAHMPDAQQTYQLMLSAAGDSAGNFSIYSAYVYVPAWKKWKLMGTCRVADTYEAIKEPKVWWQAAASRPWVAEAWAQQLNGNWLNLMENTAKPPNINLNNHADSLAQVSLDLARIKKAIADGSTDAILEHKGIYYAMMHEGYGKPIAVTDTVTIFYKGYLLSDGTIFDQTTDSPRRFPLNRLIPGWQIGVPLCTTGGKIKLVIPSHLAYGIRTRSPKIPPNSILVFEIEVVDTTPVVKPS
ncbi:MAG TPA: FKBP-type peptidyl-prolyl cis-trans isomerase, partial [Phnomibacter sp.]|nr:FKBP-type peptidyl-prolyl cis-trans isomerase [Phnomibacter sp.]